MEFCKMQGIGNDYIYVNCIAMTEVEIEKIISMTKKLCNRNFGIGADGVILICKSTIDTTVCKMRIFNKDGTEARNVWKWNKMCRKIHI